MIHVVVWQKPSQHCQAIFLQLKNKLKKKITTERMHNITIISEIQRRNMATGTCLWRCDFSARNKGLAESTFVLFSHSRTMRDIEFGSWKGIQDSISLAIHSGEGNCTPLQYSCLENPMDRGAWKDSMESLRVRHD